MSFEWPVLTVEQLISQGIIAVPMDGNHGEIHPKSSDFVQSGIPFVMASDLSNGLVNFDNCAFITEIQAKKLRKGFSKDGDVLLSHKATIGRTAIVKNSGFDFIVLTPQVTYYRILNKLKLDNLYLKYYFDSEPFQSLLANWAGAGSTRAYIGITAQRKLPIVCPPIDIQNDISSILEPIDNRISLLRETNTTLEAIAQTLFKSWFVDFDPVKAKAEGRLPEGMDEATAALFPSEFEESALGLIPKGWRVESVGDVMDYKEGPGIRNWQYTNSDEGTKFINIRCIQDGDLSLNSANRIKNEEANGKYIHFHLKAWDVVVSTSGTLGRSAIVRKEHLPLMLNTSVIRFRPIPERMEFCFLYQHLNSSYFLFELDAMASGSVQKNFGPMHLRRMSLVCPSFDLICRYESICKPLLQKVVDNREQIQTLTTLRDTLLPRLISGQLRLNQAQEIMDEVGA